MTTEQTTVTTTTPAAPPAPEGGIRTWEESWARGKAAAEALEAAQAKQIAGAQKPKGDRDAAGKFLPRTKDAEKPAAPTAPAETAEEKPEPEKAQAEPERVEVSERAKFRAEKREWREREARARAELTHEVERLRKAETEITARAKDLEAVASAKQAGDVIGALKALGFSVQDIAKASLARVKDPVAAAKEEVERLRAEMAERERQAEQQRAEAAQAEQYRGYLRAAQRKLAETHPGFDKSPNIVRAVVAELSADDSLTWDEAVSTVTGRDLRPEYDALRAYFDRGKQAQGEAPPPTAAPAPSPARRVSPATARDAGGAAPPAPQFKTAAERRAWMRQHDEENLRRSLAFLAQQR